MARKKSAAAAAAAETEAPVPAVPLPATPPEIGRFEIVARRRVHISQHNPRKRIAEAELAELTDSVRRHGILQPLLARPRGPEDFELAAGERRLLAAGRAGIELVPLVVRDMTDEELLDIALHENGKRADVHPLDEAEAIARKRDEFGRSVDEIAATIGRPVGYVVTRLKLIELCPEAREAYLAGKGLTLATALVIARIPDQKLQAKATKDIANGNNGQGMPYRDALRHVRDTFMLELSSAAFPITRADLVPAAGACTTCPKRTGNQRELFDDVDEKNICTDPPCFREKTDAAWKERTAQARDAGLTIIEGKAAKELFPSRWDDNPRGNDYVALDAACYEDKKHRTYRQLLKKAAKPDAVARNPHNGTSVELIAKKGLTAKLKSAGHDFKAERASAGDDSWKKRQEAERRTKLVRERAAASAMGQVVAAVEKGKADKSYFRLLVDHERDMANDDGGAFERRGLKLDDNKAVAEYVDGLTEAQLRGLLLELVIGGPVGWSGTYDKAFLAVCTHHGVDLKPLEAEARTALKAELKAKGGAKATKGGKKTAGTEVDVEELGAGDDE